MASRSTSASRAGRRPFRRVFAVAVSALGAAVAVAADGNEPSEGATLAVVTVDTLRADRLSGYGYAAPLSPHLDRVARRSRIYTQARTVAPLTLPAHASLFTGQLPSRHGVRNNGFFRLPAGAGMLAEELHARGFVTGAFVSAVVLQRAFGLDQGFDRYDDVEELHGETSPRAKLEERSGHATVDRALGWLDGLVPGRNVFLWVHLFEPHAPYAPPAPFQTWGGYEGEVATADHEVGRLARGLRRRDRRASLWIAADHGEALGAHGEPTHGVFLYDETLRIPLIGPGVEGPGIDRRSLTLADVRGLLSGGSDVAAPVVAETLAPMLDFGWSPLFAAVEGRFKLIRAPRPELYDLVRDPGERHDLLAESGAPPLKLALLLDGIAASLPRAATSALDDTERRRLEALGYLGGGQAGRQAARAAGADPKDMVALLPLLADDGSLERNLELILARDPENPLVRLRLAWLRLTQERPGDARAIFAALAESGHLGSAPLQGLAACATQSGDYRGAVPLLVEARRRDPDDRAIAFNLGGILVYLGETERGIAELEQALDDPSLGPQAAAAIYDAHSRNPGVHGRFRPDQDVDPGRLEAVARAARDRGRAAEAARIERRARDIAARDADGLVKLARTTADAELAALLVERALALEPDNVVALLTLARQRLVAGDRAGAVALRERAVAIGVSDDEQRRLLRELDRGPGS